MLAGANGGQAMRGLIGVVLGMALAAGTADAQSLLSAPWGHAVLPAGEWRIEPLAEGAQAERVLGPTQRLTASMWLEPGPAAFGEGVEPRLQRRVEDLRQSLMAMRKGLIYFEAFPMTSTPRPCYFVQSIVTEVPPYAVPGDWWSDYALHMFCALPGEAGLVVMRFAERLGTGDAYFRDRNADGEDFFDSLVMTLPSASDPQSAKRP